MGPLPPPSEPSDSSNSEEESSPPLRSKMGTIGSRKTSEEASATRSLTHTSKMKKGVQLTDGELSGGGGGTFGRFILCTTATNWDLTPPTPRTRACSVSRTPGVCTR